MCVKCEESLNYKTSQLVNFETTEDIVINGAPPVTVHTDRKIKHKRGREGGARL
jgi:hypothetical protein